MKLIAYSTIASTACAFVSTSPAAPAVSLRAVEARAVEAAPARDLTGRIPDCPATLWDDQNIDVAAARRGAAPLPECPTEHVARLSSAGPEYFRERSGAILGDLEKHGCVWFRGFDLMKTEAGFRQFYEAVGLDPCLDPIHTSGLRAFASQSDALYEEVNKESLAQHYIGLHQESTHKKTATYGAFVCFKPATVSGGEFFIADAAKIARDLDADVAQRIYDKKIRISVSNLDLNFLEAAGPFKEGLMEGAKNAVDTLVAPKFDMDLEMIYGADGKPMRLQAVEQVYHGDLSAISSDDLDHINAVSEKNIAKIPMQPGDVLLVDNYRILHGRDTFKGDRYHAVSWFGGLVKDRPADYDDGDDDAQKPGDLLNKLINKYVVDAF
ncbi:TauD/TfdA-like taurine catabolism dioxygenase [Aureococcus anophagefferens]|nr:TauD/TfdA-like taurine catabolism dioxygenase [Aureococcus anophagefferens]